MIQSVVKKKNNFNPKYKKPFIKKQLGSNKKNDFKFFKKGDASVKFSSSLKKIRRFDKSKGNFFNFKRKNNKNFYTKKNQLSSKNAIFIPFRNYRIFDSIINRRNKIVRRLSKINLSVYSSLIKNYISFKWLKDLNLVMGLGRYKKEMDSLESRGLKRKLGKRRLKIYAVALFDKQKLKGYHMGLKEYMLKNIVSTVFSTKQNPLQEFMNLLESRLLSFLYRTNYFKSIVHLKIFLKLGYIKVNGKEVNSPMFFLSVGDKVTISYKPKNARLFLKNIKKKFSLYYYPSKYMEVSFPLMAFLFYRKPQVSDVVYPFTVNLSRILYYYNYKGLR